MLDCKALDDYVETWLSGGVEKRNERPSLWDEVDERIRIPMIGGKGATHIGMDGLIILLGLPLSFVLPALTHTTAMLAPLVFDIPIIMAMVRHNIRRPESKIVHKLSLITIFWITFFSVAFEFNSTAFSISPPVILINILGFGLLFLFILFKRRSNFNKTGSKRYCRFCQRQIINKQHHCLWFESHYSNHIFGEATINKRKLTGWTSA